MSIEELVLVRQYKMSYVNFDQAKNIFSLAFFQGECPPYWKISASGTHCYFISYIRLTFTDAHLWCMERNSRLIEISNDEIFHALQSSQDSGLIWKNFYWIGLREIGENKS